MDQCIDEGAVSGVLQAHVGLELVKESSYSDQTEAPHCQRRASNALDRSPYQPQFRIRSGKA